MKPKSVSTNRSLFSIITSWLQAIGKEVAVNRLADYSELGFKWLQASWRPILYTISVFLWGILAAFARRTYSITGSQIIIGIGITIILVVAVWNAPKIRKWNLRNRQNYFAYGGYYWKYTDEKSLIGPFCPNCGKQMSEQCVDASIEMERTIDEMYGDETSYIYCCDWCEKRQETRLPISRLKKQALQEYLSRNPKK